MSIKHIPYEVDEFADPHVYHEHYWKECAINLLLKSVENPGELELLDYGCGRGEFLSLASQAGFITSGLDMDPRCVELSRRFGSAEQIDAEDYLESMADNSVDIITSFHVLEHVEHPKRLLSNMRRVARKYVLVAVPNLQAFQAWRASARLGNVNEGHLHGWDRDTLNNLAVRHCGLELVEFASDMTKVPSIGHRIQKLFGTRAEKAINLKVFSRLWPRKSISLIALFKVPE